MLQNSEQKLSIFKGKKIRKTLHNDEWWFSVVDVVEILTDTVNPIDYIKKMKKRDVELSKGWGQIVTPPLVFKLQVESKK